MMLAAVIAALVVAMALTLVRAFLGPRLYNRLLAINVFGTKTVLFISVAGVMSGRSYVFDIALIYALVNFVSTIAVLRLTHLDELLPASGGTDEGRTP
ncbi:MAG TPA: monovalent cation/H+ antiporter complex subunit F [Spirillospora sp.]